MEDVVKLSLEAIDFDPIEEYQWLRLNSESRQLPPV